MTDMEPTVNRPLSGGAKNLLDDLLALNTKTSAEMLRGLSEGYLDADGAVELANKLGVEPPRVRRNFYVYFTVTEAMSMAVSAYDEDQAVREAQRLHEFNVANGETHYGSRSRFNNSDTGPRRVYTAMTMERPTTAAIVEVLPNPDPWELEREQMRTAGRTEREQRLELTRRNRHSPIVEEDEREREQDRIRRAQIVF